MKHCAAADPMPRLEIYVMSKYERIISLILKVIVLFY